MANEEIKQLREEVDALKAVVNDLAGVLYLSRAPVLRDTNYSNEECATQLDVTQLRSYTNENLRLKADQYDFDYIVGNGFQGWTITDYIIRIREDYNQAVAMMATKEEMREIAKNGLPLSSTDKTLKLIPTEIEYELVERADLEDAMRLKQDKITIDRYPTQDSENLTTSGAIFDALNRKQDNITMDSYPALNSQNPVTSDGVARALDLKAPTMTFDTVPERYSQNPVTSDGVKRAIDNAISNIVFPSPPALVVDSSPTRYSQNPVTSGGVYEALAEKQNQIIVDNTVTANSSNPISSGAVYAAIDALEIPEPQTFLVDSVPINGSGNAVSSDGVYDALATKQDKLTFDLEPTENSSRPITSGGVYAALSNKQDSITVDNTPTRYSDNPVASGAVYDALNGMQEALTFDQVPTQGSLNPVESDGIYEALATKQNTLTFDSTPTANSSNPVTSGGIKAALDTKQNTLTIDSQIIQNGLNPASSGAVYSAIENLRQDLTDEIADNIEADTEPTEDSTNLITSGAVYDALEALDIPIITYDTSPTQGSTNPVTSNGIYEALAAVSGEAAYSFDQIPTDGSSNPVTSDGVYDAILTRQTLIRKAYIEITGTWSGSDPYWQIVTVTGVTAATMINLQPTMQQIEALRSTGIKVMWAENDDGEVKVYAQGGTTSSTIVMQCTLTDVGSDSLAQNLRSYITIDTSISGTSTNPVENRAVYMALRNKQDKIVCDDAPRQNSRRFLTSGTIYNVLQGLKTGARLENVTLDTNWTGSGPYKQIVTIEGTTSGSLVNLQASSSVLDQMEDDGVASVWTENDDGEISICTDGGPFTTSVTLQCIIYETADSDGTSLSYTEPTVDDEMDNTSDNAVSNKAVCGALALKQNVLQYDEQPRSGSNKLLTSGAVYSALSAKQNNITIDAVPTTGSNNPVSSDSLKLLFDGILSKISQIEHFVGMEEGDDP